MFDTHAHLNFKRFKKDVDSIISRMFAEAHFAGVVIPGTDLESSKRAVEIAEMHEGVYAAVGVHPHHNYNFREVSLTLPGSKPALPGQNSNQNLIADIEELLGSSKKIVAVGEIGLDRHTYEETKYENYHVDEAFIQSQRELFLLQLSLAKKHKLSVIVHNREAIRDLMDALAEAWDPYFEGKMVFHCCEPKQELLDFAIKNNIYIGIDGDITYTTEEALQKREFIKKVPAHLLVLETDSPFLLPEPLRTEKKYPNTPLNLQLVAHHVAQCRGENPEDLIISTTANAQRLFQLAEHPTL